MLLNARNRRLLSVVLILALLNALWVQTRTPTQEVRPLFGDLVPDAVARIAIEGAGEDGEGAQAVTLRQDENGLWTVEERFGWRAYAPGVEAFLRGLAAATDAEREATNRSSHGALGVGPGVGHRIRLEDRTGRVLAEMVQGAPPEGTRGSRLLPAGQDSVYRTPTVPRVVPDPSRWIDGDLVPFDVNGIEAFTLRTATPETGDEASLHFVRKENGRFGLRLSSRSLTPSVVDPFLKALERLVVRDVVPPPTGDWTPNLEVEFEVPRGDADPSSSGEILILSLGPGRDGEEKRDEALVSLEGGHLAAEEKRWFVLPRIGRDRLVALAGRLIRASQD